MKVVVCVRQGLDGEINPFDASAYEAALRIAGAEVILLSMAPASAKDFLLSLTRLGARRAVLLSDRVFAGADTLATAYALSLAIRRLSPDLVLCGRQTLVGDTAQTGPMLAEMLGFSLITNALRIELSESAVTCTTREDGAQKAALPALITVERIHTLRFPGIFSRVGEVETLTATDLGADTAKCGLSGSPTRVLATFENTSGKRKCKWITPDALMGIVAEAREKKPSLPVVDAPKTTLDRVYAVGNEVYEMASQVSSSVTVIEKTDADTIAEIIKKEQPKAVLWASDAWSKRTAATVAARLSLGLCADCTALESDGERLIMYRPALSGSIIAKIVSNTAPAMATVRTKSAADDVVVAIGYGAKDSIDKIRAFAQRIGADLAASRKVVDSDILPYPLQVGLTGKTVSPPVYIALGISGAVHHIAGMQNALTVIAVNPDKDAPIFEYADYGIVAKVEDIL